jgi:hypothetical protein
MISHVKEGLDIAGSVHSKDSNEVYCAAMTAVSDNDILLTTESCVATVTFNLLIYLRTIRLYEHLVSLPLQYLNYVRVLLSILVQTGDLNRAEALVEETSFQNSGKYIHSIHIQTTLTQSTVHTHLLYNVVLND